MKWMERFKHVFLVDPSFSNRSIWIIPFGTRKTCLKRSIQIVDFIYTEKPGARRRKTRSRILGMLYRQNVAEPKKKILLAKVKKMEITAEHIISIARINSEWALNLIPALNQ